MLISLVSNFAVLPQHSFSLPPASLFLACFLPSFPPPHFSHILGTSFVNQLFSSLQLKISHMCLLFQLAFVFQLLANHIFIQEVMYSDFVNCWYNTDLEFNDQELRPSLSFSHLDQAAWQIMELAEDRDEQAICSLGYTQCLRWRVIAQQKPLQSSECYREGVSPSR